MKKLIVITCLFMPYACTSNNDLATDPGDDKEHNLTDTALINSQDSSKKTETSFIVKDSSDYSEKFISGLSELGYKHIELNENILITDHQDTFYFPDQFPYKETVLFTTKQEHIAMALSVERINYSSIWYDLELVEFGNSSHNQEGQVDLMADFFLRNDSVKVANGKILRMNQYQGTENDSCYISIKLGNNDKVAPYWFAQVEKNCNGKIKDITPDNYPALIEKNRFSN